jgi:hypothetical protein
MPCLSPNETKKAVAGRNNAAVLKKDSNRSKPVGWLLPLPPFLMGEEGLPYACAH